MIIILKGIDLPQKLYTDIRIYKDGRIKKIIGENIMISFNKNVQVIQIPKGHGTLIDADKLLNDLYENYEFGTEWMINHAPTILEAEE